MEEVKRWMEKAESDLSDAEYNFEGGRFETSSFLSHQAAEKALKALYIIKSRRLWKIHDLGKLAIKLNADRRIIEICKELNPHYLATRYPTDVNYNKEIAKNALKLSKEVIG